MRARRFSSSASVLFVAASFVLVGCKGEAPVSAEVLEANGKEYVIGVKTLPGLSAEVSGVEAVADTSGLAKVVVPVERLSYMGGSVETAATARGRSGIKKYYGRASFSLPFSPDQAKKLPTEPFFVRVVGGGPKQISGGSLWSFGTAGGALMEQGGGITLRLLAPPKSKVVFGGKTVTMDAFGSGSVVFSPQETIGTLWSDALDGYGASQARPFTVTITRADGGSKELSLPAKWTDFSVENARPWIQGLAKSPLGGARQGEVMAIYLASRGRLTRSGRIGLMSTLDIAVTAQPKPSRKLKDCDGYVLVDSKGNSGGGSFSLPREAIDEEVIAIDAHTGKELGRKEFPAEEHCPVEKRTKDAALKVYPDAKVVLAWASKLP